MNSLSSTVQNAWYLTGPTAAGKTAVGIELARQLDAEIISLDSMCLYRGMDLGTAKPTAAERSAAVHHLLDILDPAEEFSVAQYLARAQQAAAEVAARGKQVLFVGGTALYLKALLRGLFSGPPADWTLRQEWEEVARVEGSAALHRQLAEVDARAAAKLHPNDVRRIIRALEVQRTTGVPISTFQKQFDRGRAADQCRVFALDWPRELLEERIRKRVDDMFAAGLVQEVVRLSKRQMAIGECDKSGDAQPFSRDPAGSMSADPDKLQHSSTANGAFGRTAGQALGYREVLEHLHGDRDLAATIELVKLRTRQFAKRQLTWFRSLSECRWIAVDDPLDAAEVAQRIATAVARPS